MRYGELNTVELSVSSVEFLGVTRNQRNKGTSISAVGAAFHPTYELIDLDGSPRLILMRYLESTEARETGLYLSLTARRTRSLYGR